MIIRAVNVRPFIGDDEGLATADGEFPQSRHFVDDESLFGRDVGEVGFDEGGDLVTGVAETPE